MGWRRVILPTLLLLCPAGLRAAAPAPAVDYVRQIKPLLHEKCNACHGALKQKAGLRLDAVQLLRAGGNNGALVVPGRSGQSLIVHAVEGTHDVEKMPQDGAPLSAEQVQLLRDWIDQGATAADEPVPPSPREHWAFVPPVRPAVPGAKNAARGRNPIDAFVSAGHDRLGLSPLPEAPRHLLLRRVYLNLVGVPPTVDELRAFLADESPGAYERVVDRLLADPRYGQRWGRHWMDVWRYADWAGYRQEVRDSRPGMWRWRDWIVESLNADVPYDRMVTLMLAADEQAGADRAGADRAGAASGAGGEVAADLRAGGYLARSWYKFNRNVWLDNTVEHFGKAFLGLTINCARCHDHKYDPVEQREYYQLRAFFEPTAIRSDPVAGSPDPAKDGLAMVYDKEAAAKTFLFRRGEEKQPDETKPLSAVTPEVFGPTPEVKPVDLPPAVYYPGLRDEVRNQVRDTAVAAVAKARADLEKVFTAGGDEHTVKTIEARARAAELELASVDARLAADAARHPSPTPPREPSGSAAGPPSSPSGSEDPRRSRWALVDPVALTGQFAVAVERAAAVATAEANLLAADKALADAWAVYKPTDAKAQKAIDDRVKAIPALRTALAQAEASAAKPPAADFKPLTAVYPATSTGRRSALAAWVTAPKNPLAARVAVNHVWMRHVGEPLVATVFDFGINGKPPTHPELLDWLAVEFRESGWSMKRLHKLIVTSAAYRAESGGTPGDASFAANDKLDPDNRFLWRANVRRMEAEVVRDSVLAVAGKLDCSAGGAELDQNAWQMTTRRSLYYRHANEKQGAFALVFDAPAPNECYRRAETVTPQQSLALANSPMAVSHARLLAGELAKQASPGGGGSEDGGFVAAAFERVLGRPPTDAERRACGAFLVTQAERLKDPKRLTPHEGTEQAAVEPSGDAGQRARENLVHVLLNHNDFVTVR